MQHRHYAKVSAEKGKKLKLKDGPEFEDFISGDADITGYTGELKLTKGTQR